jgi:diguanylate cyclase (GGDEF)-like protein
MNVKTLMGKPSMDGPPRSGPAAQAGQERDGRDGRDGPPGDSAAESLAAALRDYGHYAFDTEETAGTVANDRCEKWARHLLYGGPSPRPEWEDQERRGSERDWLGARHFLLAHRQKEYAYVMRAVGGLRSAIWSFVGELNRSLAGAREEDARIRACIKRLDEVSRQPSVDVMRREVATAATMLSRVLAERKSRESTQIAALHAQIEELGTQLEEARQESSLDPLTRLYNRKMLDVMLARAVDMRAVFGKRVCLLMVDADHFKQVNDRHGHAAGDEVLRALADCLTLTFPRKGDIAARYGGEEFAVHAPEAEAAEGRQMAERLLRATRLLRIAHADAEVRITVSVGVAEARADDTPQTWVQRADRALYRAKQQGRDRAESA